ncbi:hypothetical protein [Marinilabilia salmonicolor]|uniref:hypothetical protein n=1 Tax=Marinilabilia salmonicolor TaxID=989 RepID=UPI00029B0BEB|nr:hypothetical protein [Marinilabilia salmonicolor]
MENKMNFTVLLLLLMLPITVTGQGFLERVARKASEKVEQKAEEKADQKLDEKIDEGFNSLEESVDNGEEEAAAPGEERSRKKMSALMEKMGVSSEPVPISDSYHFSSKMNMHYKNMDNRGQVTDEGDVVTYLSPGEKNFAYEFISGNPSHREGPQKGIFIMDYANGATIILSDDNGEKTGVVYGIKFFDEAIEDDSETYEEETEDSDLYDSRYKKTGRTKMIAGCKCEEYAFDTEVDKGSFWVTKEAEWKANDTFSSIFKAGLYSHGIYNGMIMESESLDKETGETNMMQVTELNDAASIRFVPGDYQLTNLGSVNFNNKDESPEDE